jgi:hypothetical protein
MKDQLQIVSFEQAKSLKKAGFDWKVSGYYSIETDLCNQIKAGEYYTGMSINTCNCGFCASAPTVALALKWFRDEKETNSCVLPIGIPVRYYQFRVQGNLWSGNFKTYEEAESVLLDELLRLLEDENKTA